MKEMFEKVQGQFRGLSTLLNGLDLEKDLAKADVLAEVNDALTQTYVLLNQGFCENATMCEKCISNRDQLQVLSQMIDQCEENKKISQEATEALTHITQNLPQQLSKMTNVYLETFQKAKI